MNPPARGNRKARLAGWSCPTRRDATCGIRIFSRMQRQPGQASVPRAWLKEREPSNGFGMVAKKRANMKARMWRGSGTGSGSSAIRTGSSTKARMWRTSGTGSGSCARRSGSVSEGPYVEGERHGQWVLRTSDGSVSEGPYVEGKRHGQWVLRWADGDVQEGPYVEGKRHGRWVERSSGGRVEEGPYVEGKRHGRWVWRSNGSVWEGPYVEGKRHGQWVLRTALLGGLIGRGRLGRPVCGGEAARAVGPAEVGREHYSDHLQPGRDSGQLGWIGGSIGCPLAVVTLLMWEAGSNARIVR